MAWQVDPVNAEAMSAMVPRMRRRRGPPITENAHCASQWRNTSGAALREPTRVDRISLAPAASRTKGTRAGANAGELSSCDVSLACICAAVNSRILLRWSVDAPS